MAVSASGTITLEFVLSQVSTTDLTDGTKNAISQALTQAFASGVGLNQLDRLFADQRTLTASQTDAIDFNGGGLLDIVNAAWAPARVKFLAVKNLGPNDIQVVRPASNGIPLFLAAGDGIQLPVGGMFFGNWPSAAGVVVTAGTGDLLNVINTTTGTTDYILIAGGASA